MTTAQLGSQLSPKHKGHNMLLNVRTFLCLLIFTPRTNLRPWHCWGGQFSVHVFAHPDKSPFIINPSLSPHYKQKLSACANFMNGEMSEQRFVCTSFSDNVESDFLTEYTYPTRDDNWVFEHAATQATTQFLVRWLHKNHYLLESWDILW